MSMAPTGRGASFSSVGAGRSSVQRTDWHEVDEHRFAHEMAATPDRILRERCVEGLVAVAAHCRSAQGFSPGREKEDHRRIDKDLTKHPVDQIEKHLAA
jgi:protein required for attachment to host cells